jgi:hypothetical protein
MTIKSGAAIDDIAADVDSLIRLLESVDGYTAPASVAASAT